MINLLIVDDEVHLVDSLADTIDWRRAHVDGVFKAYSAREALETIQTEHIDIVVTDIRMPGMDGIELISRIREKWKGMKLVLLTGYADFEYAKTAMQRQVSAYLVKPVADEEILAEIARIVEQHEEEWRSIVSLERAQYTLRENLPLIQHTLLNDLLAGKMYDRAALETKLSAYGIPIGPGRRFAIAAVRMEGGFGVDGAGSESLYEFAIGNIAQEVLGQDFTLWSCKDTHQLLVFLVGLRDDSLASPWPGERLAELAVRVQHQVRAYLKGSVSIVLGRHGVFPDDVSSIYQETLAAVRRSVGGENSVFFSIEHGSPAEPDMRTIRALYEHPTLPYLLEVGNWPLIAERVDAIFAELKESGASSQEHLIEVQSFVLHAFTYIAHKNGKSFAELAGDSYDKIFVAGLFRSADSLREWTGAVLRRIRGDMETDMHDTRLTLIRKAQSFVSEHLHTDVTLPAIADHVHLHPVYLSRIFKQLTGENVSDYIHRLRMEKAAYFLKNTEMKVYEITEAVGYENPQYFSKVFRKNYGQTPLEYRETFSRL